MIFEKETYAWDRISCVSKTDDGLLPLVVLLEEYEEQLGIEHKCFPKVRPAYMYARARLNNAEPESETRIQIIFCFSPVG